MEHREWQYQVGGNRTGTVIAGIMLVIFAGLSIWLQSTKNGAFLFSMILTVFMLLAFLAALYRVLFVKLLIGQNGFYHQTKPGNGQYYDYSSIKTAWISSGKSVNGTQTGYLHYEPINAEAVVFAFLPADEDAIGYLLRCFEQRAVSGDTRKDEREYVIRGRQNMGVGLVIIVLLLCAAIALNVQILRLGLPVFVLIPGMAVPLIALTLLLNHFVFYRVSIGTDRFSVQTNPFNRKEYPYADIASYHEELKVQRHGRPGKGASTRSYYHYFIFADHNRTVRRFLFDKSLYEREINILKARIDKAHSL